MCNVVEQLKTRINEECGCLEQEFVYKNIVVTTHVEPDGTGHILLDAGDWTDETFVRLSASIASTSKAALRIMKRIATNWIDKFPQD